MRRLIFVLAVAGLAPVLAMSAAAQVRSPDYVLRGNDNDLFNDVKAQCKSLLDPLFERGRAEGENIAEMENGLGQMIAPTIQGEMSSEANLRMILGELEKQTGPDRDGGIRLTKCIVNARLAQHRNGNKPVLQAAVATSAPAPPIVSSTSASAKLCEERAEDLRAQSQRWPETGPARVRKLAGAWKDLFTGECKGVPDAATWISRADRMIARDGGPD